MPVNSNKPHLWKNDIAVSVDFYNNWFMSFAPKAYRETRQQTTEQVRQTLELTRDLTLLTPNIFRQNPTILPTLRMSTAPPVARDRLIGLAYVSKSLVVSMEKGKIPSRMSSALLDQQLEAIAEILLKLFDYDIFPWLELRMQPSDVERQRAATIIADRLCGTMTDPIIRNAQEQRQLAVIDQYLKRQGYIKMTHNANLSLAKMQPGTYNFRMNVVVGDERAVNMPIDVVIQPHQPNPGGLPILIEAKSAGDFTNTNKRRKEEATKINQLRRRYGEEVKFILFLGGYFDGGYLGYEAAEGIDWVWEHRIEDLDQLGI